MDKLILSLLVVCLLGGAASSQIWMDDFESYTASNPLPTPWTLHAGAWTVEAGQVAQAEAKFLWQYAVNSSYAYQDCVAQCLVIKNGGTTPHTLQFGGVALRCTNASTAVMVKVQNNSYTTNPTAFDSIWLYERPGSGTAKTGITPFPKALVRLLVIDQRAETHVDTDLDGIWDHKVTRTLTNTAYSGPVGLAGFGAVQCDDFDVFDAVMMDDTPIVQPQPNTTIKFVLRGLPNTRFQAASSLGNAGIPLPDGRVIPLTADSLFFFSVSGLAPTLFIGYNGTLDANGDSFVEIALPNITALVGVTFFNGFANYSNTLGILNISNDHQVTIVP